MTLPTSIAAGDTLSWTTSLADYLATAGWALHYRIVSPSSSHAFDATTSGSDFAVTVDAAATAAWAPGSYQLVGWVTKAAERHTVSRSTLTVTPNLATAKTYDTRSPARQALEECDAALRIYGAKAYLQSVTVGDRAKQFRSPAEFMAFRSKLQAEVAREDAAERSANGLPRKTQLRVRFPPRC